MRPEEKVFEVYPPKTKIDIYGECHDEDEELRKAYIKGCHDTVAEIMGDTIKRTELPTSLEEAAEKYLDTLEVAELFCGSYEAWQVSDAFKAAAEWMAKQGVTFTAAVDHYEDFYLDSCDQEAEAIKKLGLKVMDWAIVQIRKK